MAHLRSGLRRRVAGLEQVAGAADADAQFEAVTVGAAVVAALRVWEDAHRNGSPPPDLAELVAGCLKSKREDATRPLGRWVATLPPPARRVFGWALGRDA